MLKELYSTGRHFTFISAVLSGNFSSSVREFYTYKLQTCSLLLQISGCLRLRICLLIWGAHCYAKLISLMKANIKCEFL